MQQRKQIIYRILLLIPKRNFVLIANLKPCSKFEIEIFRVGNGSKNFTHSNQVHHRRLSSDHNSKVLFFFENQLRSSFKK